MGRNERLCFDRRLWHIEEGLGVTPRLCWAFDILENSGDLLPPLQLQILCHFKEVCYMIVTTETRNKLC